MDRGAVPEFVDLHFDLDLDIDLDFKLQCAFNIDFNIDFNINFNFDRNQLLNILQYPCGPAPVCLCRLRLEHCEQQLSQPAMCGEYIDEFVQPSTEFLHLECYNRHVPKRLSRLQCGHLFLLPSNLHV